MQNHSIKNKNDTKWKFLNHHNTSALLHLSKIDDATNAEKEAEKQH